MRMEWSNVREEPDLLGKLLSSDVTKELLVLFHSNPGLVDTLEGTARRIGRTRGSIEADVKDLVSLGLLRMEKIGGSEVVLFDRAKDQEIQEIIVARLKQGA